jgi:hypothetical protein
VAPSARPSGSTSAASSARRSARAAGTSANDACFPVLTVLEAVDEVEGLGLEQRELLLDGDREVLCRLEALERLVEDRLARPRAGRLAH